MTSGMQAGDLYAAIAEWYDLEHDPLADDVECYASLIGSAHEGAANVLEVGSGTGRIAAALAVAGHRVTGVEPSEAMRARATARAAKLPERVARRLTMLAGSATDLPLADSTRFDVVLYGLNTFAHLVTANERQRALAEARRVLRAGGLLVLDLDLLGPRRLLATAGQLWWQGTWPLGAGDREVSHFVAALPGASHGSLRVTHFYDINVPGGPVHRTIAPMTLALLSPGEVELALQHAGFQIEGVYGSHELGPMDEGAPRAIFTAHAV